MSETVSAPLPVVSTVADVRRLTEMWRLDLKTVALVPTMGALHEGHVSLIETAMAEADRVIVSIFVNPKQFGPDEDLGHYPRPLEEDLRLLEEIGAHAAYTPSAEEMYPFEHQTVIQVPRISAPLDGETRGPHYFAGIATVVAKLLLQVRPHVVVFGEKDYQQTLVIERMMTDLGLGPDGLGTRLVRAPTIREEDGLALSSRNRYLTTAQRLTAARLSGIMSRTIEAILSGRSGEEACAEGAEELLEVGFREVEYFELRGMPNLGTRDTVLHGDVRLFASVILGRTRLIDNMLVSSNDPADLPD